jgi:hypothetical protein
MINFLAKHNISIIRSSAIYDIVATIGFAPPFAAITIAHLTTLHNSLGLQGTFPQFAANQLVFTNLLGIVVVMWAGLRIIKPQPYYGFVDSLGRIGFASTMAYYLTVLNFSHLLIGFFVLESLWAIVQLAAFVAYRRQRTFTRS